MRRRARCFLPLLLAWGAAGVARCEEAGPPPGAARRAGPALGFALETADVERLPSDLAQDPEHGMVLRLNAHWGEIEREAGVYDWSALAPEIARLKGIGYRVVLCLTGSNPLYLPAGDPPSPLQGDSLSKWVEFVRSAVRTFATTVSVFEIWDGPGTPKPDGTPAFEPDVYAFVLKNSALAARTEARAAGTDLLVAEGALAAGSLDWQEKLWAADVAAYIDVLPVRQEAGAGGGPVAGALRRVFDAAIAHPPVPKIWAYLEPAQEQPDSAALAVVEAAATNAEVALARAPADAKPLEEQTRWLYGLHRILAAGYGPAPPGVLSFTDESGKPLAGPRVLGRFVNEEDLSTVVVYVAPEHVGRSEAILVLDVRDARDATVLDPGTGQTWTSTVGALKEGPRRAAAGVLLAEHPMALRFRRAVEVGLEPPGEKLQVASARGLTAEEIIARHQQVEKVQEDRLGRWTARGRVDFHYKFAQGSGTLDVAIESNYFWARGGRLEWEQTDYYVNGNKIGWAKIPKLPLIQPERVVTAPLDLTLDKTYTYRLVGEERLGEREAYVLAFEPAEPDSPRALYRGRVWIDRTSFVRLQLAVVQTGGLDPPVVSNEEKSTYDSVVAPGGEIFWMLTGTHGQQLWTVAGRNVVVQRKLTFTSFEINPPAPEFEERRKTAYASERQMLRDTDEGFRYLERQPDGSRTIDQTMDTSQLFAAGGVYKDSSLSSVVPLGGVNYFNYDVAHRKMQANVFFAGVLVLATFSDPHLFGTRIDATAGATVFALKRTDKLFRGDTEVEGERVAYRSQNVSGRLGLPAGQFFRITLIGDLTFYSYSRDDRTDPALVLPQDHQVLTGTLQAEFNRKGYGLAVFGSASRRSRWEPWGIPDGTGGFSDFDPTQKRFTNWGVDGTKEWFLPKFQQIRASASYLDGRDLDRFSRSQFSYFGGTRLSGFSGTGVRFDRGWIARLGYDFNLFKIVRLEANLDHARVEDEAAQVGTQRFTGAGVSGNFVGPWKTVISLGYGRAMASDIPELVGKQEFFLAVFKLFVR